MEDESSESRKQAMLAILELTNMISVPMSLHAIVRLNVADAIWQGGANSPTSAPEILSRILPSDGGDAENLQRILRMLTSYGVFTEHLDGDGSLRKYSLTEIGKTLVTDSNGLSPGLFVLQHHQDALIRAWPLMHEVVVDPTTQPFVKLHGETPYDYYGKNPEMTELMVKAMSGVSLPVMKTLLSNYDGFKGLHTLVDVAGSTGDCLKMILHSYPNIREAINFDLPEVVAKAPNIPGVTHIGGDMLKFIPSADAIFMKWALPIWTDDECKKIMENCYRALPIGGKLIVCEPVMPNHSDDSHRTRAIMESDVFIMAIYRAKGKHRTEVEFEQMGRSVGFSDFKPYYIDYYFTVLEFLK